MTKKTIVSVLAVVSALFLAGCSTYQYYPYSGDAVVYEGKGGAMEVVDGAEIWIKGPRTKNSLFSDISTDDIPMNGLPKTV